jgi:hypothetical protein
MSRKRNIFWPGVIDAAHEIVRGSALPLTLRGLHYRLVSLPEQGYPNTTYAYKRLSELTAAGRREGTFPDLIDQTRRIERPWFYGSTEDALSQLVEDYRRDRTEGQEAALYVGTEKRTLLPLLTGALDERGIPVVPLGGYTSQTFIDDVVRNALADGRPPVLLYLGDFDPSGEDIERDFLTRTRGVFREAHRVALTRAQVVEEFDLPVAVGKETDSRSAAFRLRYGELVQVELEALPPEDLVDLLERAIEPYWDASRAEAVLAEESGDRRQLKELAS